MNIRPIANINDANGIATTNKVKENSVTVWCTPTGLTQVLNSRVKTDAVNVGSVGDKYKEKFTQENPAN